MSEAVRLVIWDLDETFWDGTLTEGGICFREENSNIVKTLTARGIMNSICSKNDHDKVKEILIQNNIWDYFLFPSINWSSKGDRVRQIIEDFQLRSASVMFIDDNPLNTNEVKSVVADIQIEDENFIKDMMNDERFVGKSDPELKRLAQYKVLEARKEDKISAQNDNIAFLRGSNIFVQIINDVELDLDRAVELINRTNQLNFTKKRLPEDLADAKNILVREMNSFETQVGLVKVFDKYGDYGIVGFFMVKGHLQGTRELIHFCFSCRTLGMHVESWVYQRLGCPILKIAGEVIYDVRDNISVDWISAVDDGKNLSDIEGNKSIFPEIRMQGGCELMALSHYFSVNSAKLNVRSNTYRNDMAVNFGNSVHLVESMSHRRYEQKMLHGFGLLGFEKTDLTDTFFAGAKHGSLLISSFWGDLSSIFFRSNKNPNVLSAIGSNFVNFNELPMNDIEETLIIAGLDEKTSANVRAAMLEVRENWSKISHTLPHELVVHNFKTIASCVPDYVHLVIIMPSRLMVRNGELVTRHEAVNYGNIVEQCISGKPNISTVYVDKHIQNAGEIEEHQDHFSRMVYYRLYKSILEIIHHI